MHRDTDLRVVYEFKDPIEEEVKKDLEKLKKLEPFNWNKFLNEAESAFWMCIRIIATLCLLGCVAFTTFKMDQSGQKRVAKEKQEQKQAQDQYRNMYFQWQETHTSRQESYARLLYGCLRSAGTYRDCRQMAPVAP